MQRYLDIINHFGVRNQMKKLNEEIYEFIEAVDTLEDTDDSKLRVIFRDNVVDELGDVLILLTQFIAKYEISKDELDIHMDRKLERTEQRIKDNYYGDSNE